MTNRLTHKNSDRPNATVTNGFHRLMTTNWDWLLQSAVNRWIDRNRAGYVPWFLRPTSHVYHLNGSFEPGSFSGRSPVILETDAASDRVQSFEANVAFNKLLWSEVVVAVGMSFECDTDRGLLAALRKHEDNVPLGEAHFFLVDCSPETLRSNVEKFSACFPRASITPVFSDFSEWSAKGMPELTRVGLFKPSSQRSG